jgi:hypothetical protein
VIVESFVNFSCDLTGFVDRPTSEMLHFDGFDPSTIIDISSQLVTERDGVRAGS